MNLVDYEMIQFGRIVNFICNRLSEKYQDVQQEIRPSPQSWKLLEPFSILTTRNKCNNNAVMTWSFNKTINRTIRDRFCHASILHLGWCLMILVRVLSFVFLLFWMPFKFQSLSLYKYGPWWSFTVDNHCVDAGVEYCSIKYLLILPEK